MHKIVEIESLRGLCAWWVVIAHAVLALGQPIHRLLDPGLAVDIFIMVSGFVIALTLDQKREGYLPFIVRRAFRLFPVYLPILAVAALTLSWQAEAILGSPFVQGEQNQYRLTLFASAQEHLWANILTHVLLIQGLVPNSIVPHSAMTLVGQAWSVSLEWQFYLVAPFIIWAAINPRSRWMLLLIVLALTLAAGRMGQAFLPNQALFFAIGIACYFATSRLDVEKYGRALALGLIAAGLLSRSVPVLVWGGVLGAVLWKDGPGFGAARKLLNHPALQYLGRISYSTYLVHLLVMYAVMTLLNRFALAPAAYGVLLMTLVILATLGASAFLYRYVEAPGIALGRQVLKRLPQGRSRAKAPALAVDPPGHAW